MINKKQVSSHDENNFDIANHSSRIAKTAKYKYLAVAASFVLAPVLTHFVSKHDLGKNINAVNEGGKPSETQDKHEVSMMDALTHGVTTTEEFSSIVVLLFLYSLYEAFKGWQKLNGEKEVSLDIIKDEKTKEIKKDKNTKGVTEDALDIYLQRLKGIFSNEGLEGLENFINRLPEESKNYSVNKMMQFFLEKRQSDDLEHLKATLEILTEISNKKIENLKKADKRRSHWAKVISILGLMGTAIGMINAMDKPAGPEMVSAMKLSFVKMLIATPLAAISGGFSGHVILKLKKREEVKDRVIDWISKNIVQSVPKPAKPQSAQTTDTGNGKNTKKGIKTSGV